MKSDNNGFSLIELLIAMAIAAILATIAYPSYRQHILKSHRTEAKNLLVDIATRQERFFTQNNRYASKLSLMNFSTDTVATETGRYNVSISASTNITYTAQAVPTSIGTQNSDLCGSFSINEQGVHSVSGTEGRCW